MPSFIAWLNTNSNAVQAFGSIAAVLVSGASLAVTIVLARLTGKYVDLTNTIASATTAQAQFNSDLRQAQMAGASASLYHHVHRLNAVTNAFPEDKVPVDRLRHFALYDETDATELQRLTQIVGGDVEKKAATALIALRWLLGFIDRIKQTSQGQGYVASDEEQHNYQNSLKTLKRTLSSIQDTCRPSK
jgi:hypothetical protein